jgi:hypothetical protein
MTALERYEDRAPALVDHQSAAVHRLAEWATSAQAASTIAAELVRTSFVPESFRGKPAEATAAILSGLEMGLQPMASLRSFDVISGQAAPRAITLRAVAQAHGHEIVLEESTGTRCVMRGRRAGSSNWQKVTWTIDRARSLGVTNKNNWRTQPQAMLVARATSEIARLVAADAILGLAYSAEELADGVEVGTEALATSASDEPVPIEGKRRMSRRKPDPVPAEEPPAEVDVEEGEVAAPRLSDPQMRKLRALYGDLGISSGREQKRVTALILGVDEIATHSDLTPEQASTVIDRLTALEAGFCEFELDDQATVVGIRDAIPSFSAPRTGEVSDA